MGTSEINAREARNRQLHADLVAHMQAEAAKAPPLSTELASFIVAVLLGARGDR